MWYCTRIFYTFGTLRRIVRVRVCDQVKGVATAQCFVLLLTKHVFTRWFCRLEIRTALFLRLPGLIGRPEL